MGVTDLWRRKPAYADISRNSSVRGTYARAAILFMSPPGCTLSYYVLDAQLFLSLVFHLTDSKLSLVL